MMLPDLKVFLATEHADMRKSFNGLAALVKVAMGKDVFHGELFVFFNRKADTVRILWWDRNGFCIWTKRLEKGKFRRPQIAGKAATLRLHELTLLLEGIDLTDKRRLAAI